MFGIVVKDPLYPSQPLYDYDVGVACPVDFTVTFTIPTDMSDDYDKTLLVHISDSYRTIKITVFRPAPNHRQQTFGAFKETQKTRFIRKLTKIDDAICKQHIWVTQSACMTCLYN